jgi:hypothetical protein
MSLLALCAFASVVGACVRRVATVPVPPLVQPSVPNEDTHDASSTIGNDRAPNEEAADQNLSRETSVAAPSATVSGAATPSTSSASSAPTLIFERPYATDAPTTSRNKYHPGTRVVVEARALKKRVLAKTSKRKILTEQSLVAEARARGYWPFRRCFETKGLSTDEAGGETKIRVSINARGSVSTARLLKTELKNESVAQCLTREANKLKFSPAPRRIDAELGVSIWRGDADAALAPTTQPVITELPEFDPDAVLRVAELVRPALQSCFEAGRRRDAALAGRLALRIILEIEGTVHLIEEHDSYFQDVTVIRCAEETLASLVFPSVAGRPFSFVFGMQFGEQPASPTQAVVVETPATPE